MVAPGIQPGEPVYIQVRIYEMNPGEAFEPERGPTLYEWGESEVLRIQTYGSRNAAYLVGLHSVQFEARHLQSELVGDDVVLRWLKPIGGGYVLEATSSLTPPRTWLPIAEERLVPPFNVNLEMVSVTNRMTGHSMFYRLRRLWNPPEAMGTALR